MEEIGEKVIRRSSQETGGRSAGRCGVARTTVGSTSLRDEVLECTEMRRLKVRSGAMRVRLQSWSLRRRRWASTVLRLEATTLLRSRVPVLCEEQKEKALR